MCDPPRSTIAKGNADAHGDDRRSPADLCESARARYRSIATIPRACAANLSRLSGVWLDRQCRHGDVPWTNGRSSSDADRLGLQSSASHGTDRFRSQRSDDQLDAVRSVLVIATFAAVCSSPTAQASADSPIVRIATVLVIRCCINRTRLMQIVAFTHDCRNSPVTVLPSPARSAAKPAPARESPACRTALARPTCRSRRRGRRG